MIAQGLSQLRRLMAQQSIDVYLVPTDDPHLSEYVADRYKSRAQISGFTGSAGSFFITDSQSGLFTDGRYFIQAEEELKGTEIKLFKMGVPDEPTLNAWLRDIIPNGGTLGLDPMLFSEDQLKTLKKDLDYLNYNLVFCDDLVSALWQDRPLLPESMVYEHELTYTGMTSAQKIDRIRKDMITKNTNAYMLCSLNDIAWLFNIRGNDIPFTPVTYAYAYITDDSAWLFIDMLKVSDTLKNSLTQQDIQLMPYDNFYEFLSEQEGKRIFYDPSKVNGKMITSIQEANMGIEGKDLVFYEKACFSKEELDNLNNAQIRDGVAMTKFLKWFDEQKKDGSLNENHIAEQLLSYRQEGDLFIEPSFNTIPAYGPNGAKMHYSTDANTASSLKPMSFFLIDSGGQYYDGTTDITRTIPCGPLTEEEKHDYTLVVKSHIKLNQFIFLKGSTGTNIDTISRQPMWQALMDYKSGTGHSIGYVLGVHEGPARIRKEVSDVVLKPNMVLTNEPGVYKEGQYGIRIENTMVVKELAENDMGSFYNFDVISYCPIDTRPLVTTLLDFSDIEWLNDYHTKVYSLLSPYLDLPTAKWLKEATKAI